MRHFPFLDKEIDIAGLEPFEIGVVFVVPFLAGIVLFLLVPIGKLMIVFIMFAVSVFLYVVIRRKKSDKQKGWLYREFVYKWLGRNVKKIY